MKLNRLIGIIGIVAIGAMSFSACTGKQNNTIVITKEKEPSRFSLTEAKMMDVVSTKTIALKYTQKVEKNHSFAVDNAQILGVYVSKGDEVKKGDLLAELYMPEVEEKLVEIDNILKENEKQFACVLELRDLEYSQTDRMKAAGDLDQAGADKRNASIDKKYQEQINYYTNYIEYQNNRKAVYEAEKATGRILSEIDGTVSYVKSVYRGQPSNLNQTIVTVVDSTQCAFTSNKTEFESILDSDTVYQVVTDDGVAYDTTFRMSDDGKSLMLEPVDQQFDIAIGTKATLYLELGRVDGTLAVDNQAVHRAGDQYYVYYIDDNDVRYMKYVEIGFVGDKFTEIKNGVSVGEILVKK